MNGAGSVLDAWLIARNWPVGQADAPVAVIPTVAVAEPPLPSLTVSVAVYEPLAV